MPLTAIHQTIQTLLLLSLRLNCSQNMQVTSFGLPIAKRTMSQQIFGRHTCSVKRSKTSILVTDWGYPGSRRLLQESFKTNKCKKKNGIVDLSVVESHYGMYGITVICYGCYRRGGRYAISSPTVKLFNLALNIKSLENCLQFSQIIFFLNVESRYLSYTFKEIRYLIQQIRDQKNDNNFMPQVFLSLIINIKT